MQSKCKVFVYFAYQIVNFLMFNTELFSIFISSFVSPKGQKEAHQNVLFTTMTNACGIEYKLENNFMQILSDLKFEPWVFWEAR